MRVVIMGSTSHASRSQLLLLGGAWLGALACGGPIASLDTDAATTGTGTTGPETTESTDDGMGSNGDPASCSPECTPILTPTWSYEGPPGSYAVVEMLRDADGALWLGIQQADGGVGLSRVSAQGELQWSANPGLGCQRCELADIELHPSGDVLLGATGRESVGPDQAVLARFDVAAGEVAWVRTLDLQVGKDMVPRLGELALLDDDRLIAMRVNGFSDGEVLELLDLTADGTLRWQGYLGAQQGSGGSWPPLLVRAPTGEAVGAHAWWDDQTEELLTATSRLLPPYYVTVSRVFLPLRLDDLAVDAQGHRIELARSEGNETITLVVTSRRSSDLERWTGSLPLLTTSSLRAALAVGPDGQVYTAARTTPQAPFGTPYTVMLEVARWSVDGELRWHAAQPLEVMATPDPLELVIDDDHGVIVGTVVRGRPTVTRFEQACACD